MCDGCVDVALRLKHASQIRAYRGIIRFELERTAIVVQRAIQLACSLKRRAEVVVRRGVVRSKLDGSHVVRYRCFDVTQRLLRNREVVVVLGVVRIGTEQVLEEIDLPAKLLCRQVRD